MSLSYDIVRMAGYTDADEHEWKSTPVTITAHARRGKEGGV